MPQQRSSENDILTAESSAPSPPLLEKNKKMSANLSSALETFKQQRDAAKAHYLKANRVSVFFKEYTAAVETLLAALWAEYFQNSALCLMVTGGFGRGELYPYSDLDLAVVSSETVSDDLQEKIAAFVQALWDMKLSPSIKSGSVDELCESVRDDITGDTAFFRGSFFIRQPPNSGRVDGKK